MVEVHRSGKTVFFSSHIVPDIEEICDRVIFLQEGMLVYDGSVDKLMTQHQQLTYVIKVRAPSLPNFQTHLIKIDRFPENLSVLHVHESLKNNLMAELIQQQLDVVGVEPIKPSLEEIFYKTKAAQS
jgi:ABC-2 type transport system ATP-binding protein